MDLDNIIQDFVDKYGLTKAQVVAEIEKTFSSMLSRWHQRNVVVIYTEEGCLSAVAYYDTPGSWHQIPIDITSDMRGQNTLKRILDKNLSKSATFDEVARYKCKEHDVLWGEIIKRDKAGFDVELQMEFGVKIYATCPLKYVGKHERDFLYPGEKKAFHVRRIDTVMIEDISRTQITVDRVSKTLVEKLLVSELQSCLTQIKVHCKKRYVGQKSFVETNNFIPKKTILQASKELGEHIQVNCRKDGRKQNAVEKKKENVGPSWRGNRPR